MKKLLFFFVLICLTRFANAQWQQTSLDSISVIAFAINGNNIFAGSDYGNGVYLSTNNGTNWTPVSNGFPLWYAFGTWIYPSINCMAIKGDTLFAGTTAPSTDMPGVYLSTNNGNSWTLNNSLTNTHVVSFTFSDSNIFAGSNNGVYLSTNNGTSWTAMNSGLSDTIIHSLVISGNKIFAGTHDGVFISTNNAVNWTAVNTGIPISANIGVEILAVSGTNVVAGTYSTIYPYIGTGVYFSSNNGSSWTPVNTGLPDTTWINEFAISGNNIFAGTQKGVFLSTNNGSNWTAVNTGLTNFYINALAIKGDTIFAGVDSINMGTLYGGFGVWKRSISEMTGIKEINNNESNIEVYPNPAINNITIKSLQKSTIEILNIQGQTIIQQHIQQGKTDIDISGLAKGVYILRLCNNDKSAVKKIVKE
jgi:hypothetical protein